MTILYDTTRSTKPLPKSRTMVLDSHPSPAKLNIKLKTHSLTCLNIPLETYIDFKETSSLLRNDHQNIMAGSVDRISDIPEQLNKKTSTCFSTHEPLINIVSSQQQFPIVQQEWRQVLKERFRISTSLNDSIARLRRHRHLKHIHQPSERKHRFSFSHNRSLAKFNFRPLPSSSSTVNQFDQRSNSDVSPFISLPEIRSFTDRNSFTKLKVPQLSTLSWEKSCSWSWKKNKTVQTKSTEHERILPYIKNKEIQRQMADQFHSNLPVIIESPLQQRSSLQTIHQQSHAKLTCHEQISHRLYQKKNGLPHSISNYDVSPNPVSCQSKTRYPSTPILVHTTRNHLHQFDYHSYHLGKSPLGTFDDDDDDESDSISTNSSFRSCVNSTNNDSEGDNTDSSSSLSDSCFQDLSSSYDISKEAFHETIKQPRISFRHFCILQ